MHSIYANTLNELQKIFLKRKTIAFLVITGLIPVGGAASFLIFQNKLGIFAVNSAGFPVLMLELFSTLLLPLFIFSTAAEQFSGELGEKTLKLTLMRPVTRFNVFAAKILSITVFIIINLGLIFLISTLAGLLLGGAGSNVLPDVLQGLTAYVTAIVPMVFLCIAAVFIAQFFKSSSGALTTCVFVYLAAKLVPFLSPVFAKVNPFYYTDWYMMWLGSTVGAGRLLNTFLLMLSYSLIFFGLGYYFFDKKEL